MEEQLELIQYLRGEVNELTLLKNKVENEYTATVKEFDDTFNNIQEMMPKLDKAKLVFDNLIEGKVLKWIVPLSIAVIAGLFAFLMIVAKSNFHWSMYLMGSVLGGTGFFLISSVVVLQLFRGMVDKYLIKKYPHIKKVYDRVKELKKELSLNDKKLMNLRDRKDEFRKKLTGSQEQLDRKREELNDEEEKYFNNLVGKTIVTEDGKQFIVDSSGKVKSKVKLLEDK